CLPPADPRSAISRRRTSKPCAAAAVAGALPPVCSAARSSAVRSRTTTTTAPARIIMARLLLRITMRLPAMPSLTVRGAIVPTTRVAAHFSATTATGIPARKLSGDKIEKPRAYDPGFLFLTRIFRRELQPQLFSEIAVAFQIPFPPHRRAPRAMPLQIQQKPDTSAGRARAALAAVVLNETPLEIERPADIGAKP